MAKPVYDKLSEALQEEIRIHRPEILYEDTAIRRNPGHDRANLWRPCYVRDIEKILNCPYYNRYADKTQVFSFYKNDDISRRALHVQLVSRISRNIARLLGLNIDLTEAIALGHDIGHTPFGHAGERFLNEIYHNRTGRYFNHNVHSVRVLDGIFHFNISLQVLDGILCHNGEFECQRYYPSKLDRFTAFDQKVEACYTKKNAVEGLVPSTLEGCVVRVCDMIAYIGKDRQDAKKTHLIDSEEVFADNVLGKYNAPIINNLIVNIVENSYGKDYILMDDAYYQALKKSKRDNYEYIYKNDALSQRYDEEIKPMFEKIYEALLRDLLRKDKNSVIYRHHIRYVEEQNRYYEGPCYLDTAPDQIVVDYIASMTDDYFIDLYEFLFPDEKKIAYVSYFNDVPKGGGDHEKNIDCC